MSAADEIDLLLTDVILPNGMNGRDVAENFRKIHPAAAVLYSSGYTREILSERGQLEDGTVLLSKPYQIQDLAQRVRDVLDNRL
ncbi:MAG: hybrid sensor histidine kinase/response regulator, partial [Rhodospirillaceae bacterium]|nr:hybrid sensor histidine kinase/response regulator [Rhodospirillaceae bacterium]